MARPTSWAATKRKIFTLPVSGSTSTSQNWVAKPGATALGFTAAAAMIGPPVCARLAAISLSDSGLKSPTLLLAGLAQPSSQTTPSGSTSHILAARTHSSWIIFLVVATESILVIATDVVQAPNDKQQIAPMLEKIDALPERLGQVETLSADNGYFSEANVMACMAADVEPLIAAGRQPHHPSWRERFAAAPPAPENPTPVEMMAWRLRTPQGKKRYGLRKQTPEPVFG